MQLANDVSSWTDLGELTQLESLSLNNSISRNLYIWEVAHIDLTLFALSKLRVLRAGRNLFPGNIPKYIFITCSLHLEVLRLDQLILIKHIEQLLDGTIEGDEDYDIITEEHEEEIDYGSDADEQERESKRLKLVRGWKEGKAQRWGRAHPGLKRIEISRRPSWCNPEESNKQHLTSFSESEWDEWYAKAKDMEQKRAPAFRLVNVERRISATFVKNA